MSEISTIETSNVLPYLRTQMQKARLILFTGAGFSLGTKNTLGEPFPGVDALRTSLWELAFPDSPADPSSDLQSVFEAALRRNRSKVAPLVASKLTVDPKSVPKWYNSYFQLPWHKFYTLNIDDLPSKVQMNTHLPRKIELLSGTTGHCGESESTKDRLRIIYLNGTIQDLPDNVTFSMTQYAIRVARQDPFYANLVSEALTHPFIFVGTRLEESPLWQHMELRKNRGGGAEMRPKSYLITPKLDRARQAALSQFNIHWLPMTAEQFYAEILVHLEDDIQSGLSEISKRRRNATAEEALTDLGNLLSVELKKDPSSDYLLGSEPRWIDIQTAKAIPREVDAELHALAKQRMTTRTTKGGILITGTAGSGKSSSLMRLAMALSFEGHKVGWLDGYNEAPSWAIRQCIKDAGFNVVAIDNADALGSELASLVREISLETASPLVLLGIRSGRIDRVLNPAQLGNTPINEVVMPLLTNADIDGLLKALTSDNKLGKLRGRSLEEQRAIFREKAGRELLVAMIEATSGERFEDKAVHEYEDLDDLNRKIYATVSVATAQEVPLDKTGLLLVLGQVTGNDVLNAIESLVKRHILRVVGDRPSYRARHRVIGEVIQKKLQNTGSLYEVLRGLLTYIASQVYPGMPNHARPKKLLVKLVNHNLVHRLLGPEHARNLYAELESYLREEPHFWLQRGILEIEDGNLRLAKNWLDQAKGINPNDDYIEVEYALLQFRTAITDPHNPASPDLVATAREALDRQIKANGTRWAHAYHVLGSQTIAWLRRSVEDYEVKRGLLLHALDQVRAGCISHPRNEMLNRLHKELEDEKLNLVMR